MNTAGHFTRSEIPRNHLAIDINDFCLRIDLHAAHGVMHGRSDENGIVRSLVKRTFHLGAATAAVLAGSLILSVLSHRGLQVGSGNTHVLGNFIKILTLNNHTRHLDVTFDSLQRFTHVIVKEHVCMASRLLENSSRNGITRIEFIEEALAFHIDQHSTVTANGFGYHHTGLFNHGRVSLNLIHIDESGLNLFRQQQTVARSTRMIRRSKSLQTRDDLGDHCIVACKAAGSIHHGL